MKQITSVNKLALALSWIIAGILVLLPFHAFITVWLSSLFGHYTLLRLWKEFLLVPILAGAVYILAINGELRKKLMSLWLTRLITIYGALLIICGFAALDRHAVTAKAMWYGLLVDFRFLAFFLAVLVIAASSNWLSGVSKKIILAPAIFVAAFAVLQYLVLPYDFLKHFGYGTSTISPYETINNNLSHIRVASSLRGANPLGAYLVVPICALAVWLFRERRERLDKTGLGLGLLLALMFSFSRSAWIGAALGILVVAWLSFKSPCTRKNLGLGLAGAIVIAAILTLALRNNSGFENAILHTDKNSKARVSSNEGHIAAFKSAAKDIVHQPLGAGVGTAGPQSIYNDHPGRVAENYFLQIGQEAGALGMLLFIAICVSVGKLLLERRSDPIALALFASLVGLSFVNLLSHAWTDDTLAYIWWGLAAIVCAPAIISDIHKQKDAKKVKKPA